MLKMLLVLAVFVVACLSPDAYMGAENKGLSPIGSGLLNDISVATIGYQAPSRHYTSSRLPTATLDFIDDDHLLFTFHYHQLMNRSTEADYLALERELQAVILEAKSKAAKIQEPSGLWGLEQYLTRRRQEVDRVYDYRYSILPLVFAISLER